MTEPAPGQDARRDVEPTAPRNNVVDIVRVFSIAVVVVFHALIFQAIRTPDGIEVVQWSPPRWVFWLSWVLMSMPAFFVCGGFANALIIDKMKARGQTLGHYLANRGRRLTGGLTIFVAVFAVMFSVWAWIGDARQAIDLSKQLMFLLWFLSVYLVIVLAAPLLVRLHDRFGAWVLVVMIGGILMVDRQMFLHGPDPVGQINMFLVWPLCHQLGIGYERGWFRTGPVWKTWLSFFGGIATIAVLILHFGYPESAVGFGNMPLANHIPPTFAMAVLGLVQASLMGLVERTGALDVLPRKVSKFVGRLSAVMMTVYLWQVPCLVVGGVALIGLSMVLPGMSWLFLSKVVLLAAGLVLLSLIVPPLSLLEYKLIPPLGTRQDTGLAVLAFMLSIAGSMLVWHNGAVLHPASTPASVGVIAVVASQFAMARASRPAGVQRDLADKLKPLRRRDR